MRYYNKYYKIKLYGVIRNKDLLPCIQKKTPKTSRCLWTTFDLKLGRINIDYSLFSTRLIEAFNEDQNIPWYAKIRHSFWHFLHWKLHIKRLPNTKTINTEKIKHVAIMAITKEDSMTHLESKHKYQILSGLVTSTDSRQPVFIWDNVSYTGDIPYYFSMIGRNDIHKELWDVWMNNMRDKNEKELDALRKKVANAWNKKLLEYVDFKTSEKKK